MDKSEIETKDQLIFTREVIDALPELLKSVAEVAERRGMIKVIN